MRTVYIRVFFIHRCINAYSRTPLKLVRKVVVVVVVVVVIVVVVVVREEKKDRYR